MPLFHATTVALDGRGVMIVGPSGSGKSALGLELLALGAGLVADDQTLVEAQAGAVVARCPAQLSGLIEARGLGILRAMPVQQAVLALVVDLEQVESARLPPRRIQRICGLPIELVFGSKARHFAAAILQYVKHGRRE